MSPIGECPHPEEFSALIDRELAPEEIPMLERHVAECRPCRELFLRLSAADRVLGLALRRVNLVQECIDVRPGEKDAVSDALMEQLESFGRHERMKAVKERDLAVTTTRRRRGLVVFLVLAVLLGGAVATLQPSPVADPGTARREGAYFVGPGEVGLHRGARLKLSEGTRVRFSCLFRWDRPAAHLAAGEISVLDGTLLVPAGGERPETLSKGQTATLGPDGRIAFRKAEGAPAPAPPPTPKPQ